MAALEDIYYPVKHSTIDYTFELKNILQHTFLPQTSYIQGFLAKDHIAVSGTTVKKYVTVSHFPGWLETDIIASQTDHHLYEVIPADHPVRPYFDIEYDGVNNAVLDVVCTAICNCFADLGITIRYEDISIFSASGPCASMRSGHKTSYHILLGCREVFRTMRDHKAFIEEMLLPYIDTHEELHTLLYWWNAKDIRKCVIDNAPYGSNQCFRLPFQSKEGSGRVLVPVTKIKHYCIGMYCPVADLTFIEGIPQIMTSTTVINVVKQESPEFSLIKALSALLTPEFLTDYTKTRDMIWAFWSKEQSERMRDLIHVVCERGRNYDYRWVNRIISGWKYSGLSTGSIVRWATQCSTADVVADILKRERVDYTQELFVCQMIPEHHVILHQRYLEDAIDFGDHNTILLKSHLGTGKTVCITKIISTYAPTARILVVSPRKSYTYSQCGTLSGFTSYLEHSFGNLATVDRLIIQVESLHRIGDGFKKYDLVILDEIESILNQLHSVKTNAGNLITNHEALGLAVSTANHVIMADAFLSDRTFHFSTQLRTHSKYIENTFNPYVREAIILQSVEKDVRIANIGAFCERICTALRLGQKIVVIWTSKRRGDWFAETYLKGKEFTWVFYSSDSTKEEQDGLQNVNETWKSTQCLMMTTSITVGISYDPKNTCMEFDEAFLYGTSSSAMPRDIAQALFRVRSLKANKLTYVLDTRASYDNGVRGFDNIWTELAKKENRLIREHPVVKWTTCPLWARYNYCYCENEERASRAEYKTVLEEYLVRSGYTIREEKHVPSNKLDMVFTKGGLDKWDNIDEIDDNVANHIRMEMKRGEASGEEILQYKKWRFQSELCCNTKRGQLKALWAAFYEKGHEDRFWNVVLEKRLTLTDVVRGEAMKRYGIMSTNAIRRRETMGRFLAMVGMPHSQAEITLDSDALDNVGGLLAAAEKDLREGLGLRQGRRKGDWKVAHTIDLITSVLEGWGGSDVESIVCKKKINKKLVRCYTLIINKNNIFWDVILNTAINYEENLIII